MEERARGKRTSIRSRRANSCAQKTTFISRTTFVSRKQLLSREHLSFPQNIFHFEETTLIREHLSFPHNNFRFEETTFSPCTQFQKTAFRHCDASSAFEFWAQTSQSLGCRVRSGALGVQVLGLGSKFRVGSGCLYGRWFRISS